MIDKLTKEQEEKIPQYLNKWLDIGYRTETIDRTKASDFVSFLYSDILGMKVPSQLVFLDSPMACNLAINLLKKGTSQLDSQLGSQLYSQLDSQLSSQLGSQLRSQLYSQLYSQLGSQLDSQLDSQLSSQLYSQLSSQLDSQKLDYYSSYLSNIYLYYYWFYTYDYILNELFPNKVDKFKKFTRFMEGLKHIHHIYIFDDIVFLSDFPKAIHKTSEGKLSNRYGKALEYRDSYGIYMIDGKEAKAKNLANNELNRLMYPELDHSGEFIVIPSL
jgi:hypothetical protein